MGPGGDKDIEGRRGEEFLGERVCRTEIETLPPAGKKDDTLFVSRVRVVFRERSEKTRRDGGELLFLKLGVLTVNIS